MLVLVVLLLDNLLPRLLGLLRLLLLVALVEPIQVRLGTPPQDDDAGADLRLVIAARILRFAFFSAVRGLCVLESW